MALLDRLPTARSERAPLRKRFRLPGVRGIIAEQVEIPTINTLEELAISIRHAEDDASEDTIEMVLELDSVAEQVIEEIDQKQYASLDDVWVAASAWDVARHTTVEPEARANVDVLMNHVMEKTGALAARHALNAAYSRAKSDETTTFADELDRFNEEQRTGEKSRVTVG